MTTLVVGPQGLHDLPVGHAVPRSSALVHYGEHTCPNTGGWIPGYPEDEHNSAGQPLHPFDIVTARFGKGAPITDEYIWSKSIATARGIRVGSSEAQVRAAYPSASTTKSYSTIVYVVAGSGGKLLIEVALHNANAAGEWPATTLGTVVWMHAITAHAKVVSIADDDDAGPCPLPGDDPAGTDTDGD